MGKRKTDDFIVSDEEDDESVKTASDESEDSGISAESAEVKPKSRKVRHSPTLDTNRVLKSAYRAKAKLLPKTKIVTKHRRKNPKNLKQKTPSLSKYVRVPVLNPLANSLPLLETKDCFRVLGITFKGCHCSDQFRQ